MMPHPKKVAKIKKHSAPVGGRGHVGYAVCVYILDCRRSQPRRYSSQCLTLLSKVYKIKSRLSELPIYFAGKLQPAQAKRRTLFHHIFLSSEEENREILEQPAGDGGGDLLTQWIAKYGYMPIVLIGMAGLAMEIGAPRTSKTR